MQNFFSDLILQLPPVGPPVCYRGGVCEAKQYDSQYQLQSTRDPMLKLLRLKDWSVDVAVSDERRHRDPGDWERHAHRLLRHPPASTTS